MSDGSEERFNVERAPREHVDRPGWDIMRTPTRGTILLGVVSHDLYGIRTHWWYGRTTPCLKKDCPGCRVGQATRWHGYILAQLHKDHSRVIFEFTSPGYGVLDSHFRRFGTLRGICVAASRARQHDRAKVNLAIPGVYKEALELPPDEPTWLVLAKIWCVNAGDIGDAQPPDRVPLTEAERVQQGIPPVVNHIDDEWVLSRTKDLAGQLKLPMESPPGSNGNGASQ